MEIRLHILKKIIHGPDSARIRHHLGNLHRRLQTSILGQSRQQIGFDIHGFLGHSGHGFQHIGVACRVVEHRQLVQGLQAHIVQKLTGGGKQRRTPHRFAVADDLHPTPIFQLLDDQAVDRHTANVFNIPTRDRLPVGNDGQGFHGGTGVAWRLFGVQPVQILPHFGATLKSPPRRYLHQLYAALRPIKLQFLQQHLEGVGPQRIIEQHPQLAHRHGLLRADQRSFEDPLGIHRVHGSAIPGKVPRVATGVTSTAGAIIGAPRNGAGALVEPGGIPAAGWGRHGHSGRIVAEAPF